MVSKNNWPHNPSADRLETGHRFAAALLGWNRDFNTREMPWKGEKDPYKIWLSEVILQQTRVEQGMSYYLRFIENFPGVRALAAAPEEKVFKLWEGLGYYSRCRNLIATAKYIADELNGIFPRDYPSILQLKGVGQYTAAAIASFAYNLPYAVLDGNVFRVLSRICDVETAVDTTEGKKRFASIAGAILPAGEAASFNQAIMDFGAVICTPVPKCASCFFNSQCRAYALGKQMTLPVKEKKLIRKERHFNYVIVRYKDRLLIRQRKGKDIWQQLFEFPLMETEGAETLQSLLTMAEEQFKMPEYTVVSEHFSSQMLTHQHIHFHFLVLTIPGIFDVPGYFWAKLPELKQYAFPRTLQQFIKAQWI